MEVLVGASGTEPSGWMSCCSHQRSQVYSCCCRKDVDCLGSHTQIRQRPSADELGQVRAGLKDQLGGATHSTEGGTRHLSLFLYCCCCCPMWMFLYRAGIAGLALSLAHPHCCWKWWWWDGRWGPRRSSHAARPRDVTDVECGRDTYMYVIIHCRTQAGSNPEGKIK
jgi:hypothetical protein